ncbi:hypothetical protein [uncultured Bacteroides sp.]|uniref:hypothetical protein n=1 Tax=uncultured Bacteroides sp. TaxID=162156 RepID=UPI002629F94E|nr:hypothetical protein [uncultured Bacteroides sp.]
MKYLTFAYLVFFVFCFIFSFRIIGAINSSMLVGGLCLALLMMRKKGVVVFKKTLSSVYVAKMLKFIYVLFFFSLFFPILHQSFDFYFTKVVLALLIQFILGCFLWAFWKYISNERKCYYDIEKIIIYAFIIQSMIQCIVSFTPSLQPFIFYFNNAESINESYNLLFGTGVRGVALASGTGFSLSLGYGIAFIIYVKKYLLYKLSLINVLIGAILFVGIFFAGRTGFVGVGIASIYYFLDKNSGTLLTKIGKVFNLLFYLLLLCFVIYCIFIDFVNHLIDNVFPFAFEPLYNLFNNDSFETASTNRLQEMWKVSITWDELFLGTGCYFDPLYPHTFYKQVDIGLFKNIFFWGIWGYILVLLFQYVQLYPLRFKLDKSDKYYLYAIFLFLLLLDLKAIALGLNKTAFSIILLIVFAYEKNINNHSFCTK